MIAIQEDDVDIGALITAAKKHGTGAVVVFDGVVRDDNITEMESKLTRMLRYSNWIRLPGMRQSSSIYSTSI